MPTRLTNPACDCVKMAPAPRPRRGSGPMLSFHRGLTLRGRGGFTIVELVVVIGIVIILLSILIVTVRAATRTAQRTNTGALLTSIEKALTQFKGDVGYFPPVLRPPLTGTPSAPNDYRRLHSGPATIPTDEPVPAAFADDLQEWYSITTLAEYLIGYGDRTTDGYGAEVTDPLTDPERPLLGIRHPGADGVWGASLATGGLVSDRNPVVTGKVYGPYLELSDQRLLAGFVLDTAGNPRLVFPGEALPVGVTFDELPKVIVDYWGSPIRYYRTLYRAGSIDQPYRAYQPGTTLPAAYTPTLADVFLLRPWELTPGSGVDGVPDDQADTTTSTALRSAPFALFSAGHDRKFDAEVRRDDAPQTATLHKDRVNEDNLVEVGK